MITPDEKPNFVGASLIAVLLKRLKVERVYGLQGGHIQPIWDAFTRIGGTVIDARDERSAVHMAHAEAEFGGCLGVAMVTAGPGVTNAVTGIANADKARAPLLLIGGAVPRPQKGAGALQELCQIDVMRAITRATISVRNVERLEQDFLTGISSAKGDGGIPGPVFIEVPTDVLRESVAVSSGIEKSDFFRQVRVQRADDSILEAAVDLLWDATRPVVISGRGARLSAKSLSRLLDVTGSLYLDTQESRGLIPEDHPSVVSAVRGSVMREADLVVTVGRKLDYQLGYGSPAVFPTARFLRIGDNLSELRDGRRGDVEVLGSVQFTCEALVKIGQKRISRVDTRWAEEQRSKHVERSGSLKEKMANAAPGADGLMHPYRLLSEIRKYINPETILIADGGDILSFCRICLFSNIYLDSGVFGCLGVGVPFGVAAGIAYRDRRVMVVTGDGAFGFNAMELDTAVRHGSRVVFIVANNGGWNIERTDQLQNYGGRIEGSELRFSDYAGLARSLGLYAERVYNPEDLGGALERTFSRAPALLDVLVTRDAISPDASSGLATVPDFQPLTSWNDAETALLGED
mgnify:CR=1 FL=1